MYEADSSFPGTAWQGYSTMDPAWQKRPGRDGAWESAPSQGCPGSLGTPSWEWAGWMTCGSSSKPGCGAEGALEGRRLQPSSCSDPPVRTVTPHFRDEDMEAQGHQSGRWQSSQPCSPQAWPVTLDLHLPWVRALDHLALPSGQGRDDQF